MTSFVRFSHKYRSYRTFKSRGIIRGPVTVLFKYSVLNTGSSEFHQITAMPRSDFTLAVLHSFSKSETCAHKLLADTAEVSFARYIFHNTQTLLPFLTSFVGICLILWVRGLFSSLYPVLQGPACVRRSLLAPIHTISAVAVTPPQNLYFRVT